MRPPLNFELLETVIRSKIASFDGIASIFIMDLQTGEEIRINSDLALSGMSILKIPIFVEAFRHLSRCRLRITSSRSSTIRRCARATMAPTFSSTLSPAKRMRMQVPTS
jgi:beta-lactamase class A